MVLNFVQVFSLLMQTSTPERLSMTNWNPFCMSSDQQHFRLGLLGVSLFIMFIVLQSSNLKYFPDRNFLGSIQWSSSIHTTLSKPFRTYQTTHIPTEQKNIERRWTRRFSESIGQYGELKTWKNHSSNKDCFSLLLACSIFAFIWLYLGFHFYGACRYFQIKMIKHLDLLENTKIDLFYIFSFHVCSFIWACHLICHPSIVY